MALCNLRLYRFFSAFILLLKKKIKHNNKVSSGWARPHKSKEVSRSLFAFSKINLLQAPGIWDKVGLLTPNKRTIMRTDRKKDLDKYYNDHLKMQIIRRLTMVDTWAEIMGIDSAVWEAISREEDADRAKEKEFEEWKKTEEKK